jgi:hypothetical protein
MVPSARNGFYESERYVQYKVQIFGVSVEPAEETRKLLDRILRDCQEDRPHISFSPTAGNSGEGLNPVFVLVFVVLGGVSFNV